MTKKCPKCKEIFPGKATYCDIDGIALQIVAENKQLTEDKQSFAPQQPVKAKKTKLGYKFLFVGTIFLLILLIAIPFFILDYVLSCIQVEVEHISLKPATQQSKETANSNNHADSKLNDFIDQTNNIIKTAIGNNELNLALNIKNKSLLSFDINALHYQINVNQEEIGNGEWNPQNSKSVTVLAGQSNPIIVNFRIDDPLNATTSTLKILTGSSPIVSVKGDVTISFLFFESKYHFEKLGTKIIIDK